MQNYELGHFLPHPHCYQCSSPFTFGPPWTKITLGNPTIPPSLPLWILNKVNIRTTQKSTQVSEYVQYFSQVKNKAQEERHIRQRQHAILKSYIPRALVTKVQSPNHSHYLAEWAGAERRVHGRHDAPATGTPVPLPTATAPAPDRPLEAWNFTFHRFSHLF